MFSWTVNALISVLGEQRALEFMRRHGGTRVSFTMCLPDKAEAARLIEAFNGERCFFVPKADQMERAIRDREIADGYRAGKTARSLAAEYRLTEASVYRIVRASHPE